MIGFMKQLNVLALNAKDVKDHLPTDTRQEAAALADYAAAASSFTRPETIYFAKDKMRTSGTSSNTASGQVLPSSSRDQHGNPAANREVRKRIRISVRDPQSRAEDKLWHSPLDVLKA